jgi:hypothetical protein
MPQLDQKATSIFAGKVVRKDLVRKVSAAFWSGAKSALWPGPGRADWIAKTGSTIFPKYRKNARKALEVEHPKMV